MSVKVLRPFSSFPVVTSFTSVTMDERTDSYTKNQITGNVGWLA